ncbi:HAD-IIB family hydrolase [Rhodoferax sp.]|uniref:HAD-IIB family hydrolase n=1 Tax=Rhodoferax sp. TaxID=50421 RepID=UPI00262B5750|nr:HAD-IIB family hydrolase [Rhodoferax sp.]MDD2924685.1 HAD-IIB family hydrolase [Rhodoferax sp.]
MDALAHWPLAQRRRIVGVLTDIDDTLTTDGAITPDALGALADLQQAGLHVMAITGRPIGWCGPFACGDLARGVMPWPMDAFVAENGAVAWVEAVAALSESVKNTSKNGLQPAQNKPRQLSKIYQQDATTRADNHLKMQLVAQQVLHEIPHARLSQDSPGRETDIAIDHSEFSHLSAADIAHAVRIMQSAGMTATVSSIHINGWYGEHNKLSGARWIVRELLQRELDQELDQWVYVGDSTNDQLMFAHFPHSVGVANIRRFEAELTHQPRYITRSERGTGFAEVAQAILQARAV